MTEAPEVRIIRTMLKELLREAVKEYNSLVRAMEWLDRIYFTLKEPIIMEDMEGWWGE